MIRRYPTVCWSLLRLFRVSIGRKPISEMELLGLSGPRVEDLEAPGEGTTPHTADLPDTFKRGIVKWGDISKARFEQDKNIASTGEAGGYIDQNKIGPLTVLFSHIIAESRSQ